MISNLLHPLSPINSEHQRLWDTSFPVLKLQAHDIKMKWYHDLNRNVAHCNRTVLSVRSLNCAF